MGKYIFCGKINKYHGYIFLSIIFMLIQDLVFGFNYNNSFIETKLFGLSKQYTIIHNLFCYIVLFVSSFIFYKCQNKKSENLLANKITNVEKKYYSKKYFSTLLLIIILGVIEEQLIEIYTDSLIE